jgi:hypothetical protein
MNNQEASVSALVTPILVPVTASTMTNMPVLMVRVPLPTVMPPAPSSAKTPNVVVQAPSDLPSLGHSQDDAWSDDVFDGDSTNKQNKKRTITSIIIDSGNPLKRNIVNPCLFSN